MNLDDYNKRFVQELERCHRDYIRNTAQPTMMGGAILRRNPLPGNTVANGSPSTLAVGAPIQRGRLGLAQQMVGEDTGIKVGGRRRKGNFLGDVAKGLGSIGKVLAPIGKEVGKEVLKDSIKGMLMAGAGQARRRRPRRTVQGAGFDFLDIVNRAKPVANEVSKAFKPKKRAAKEVPYPASLQGGQLSGGHCGAKGRGARNAIVQKVMQQKGLKLIEASKYVKAHNLY